MSMVCVLAATLVIPVLARSNPLLVVLLSPLAWVMAAVFGVISLIRVLKQRTSAPFSPPRKPVATERLEPSMTAADLPASKPERVSSTRALRQTTVTGMQKPPTSWSRELIDRIEWKRFEDLCCEFYRVKGIRAETTRLGADGGVDVRLFQDESDPQCCTALVQCKAWSQEVGVKPVRELRGVMAHENVEKAFFMAPNGFTDDAKAFAAENCINLLDGKLFLAMIERLPAMKQQQLLAFATTGEWTIPSCPSCGAKMAARESKRGTFWGCIRYPKCRATLPMRASVA